MRRDFRQRFCSPKCREEERKEVDNESGVRRVYCRNWVRSRRLRRTPAEIAKAKAYQDRYYSDNLELLRQQGRDYYWLKVLKKDHVPPKRGKKNEIVEPIRRRNNGSYYDLRIEDKGSREVG